MRPADCELRAFIGAESPMFAPRADAKDKAWTVGHTGDRETWSRFQPVRTLLGSSIAALRCGRIPRRGCQGLDAREWMQTRCCGRAARRHAPRIPGTFGEDQILASGCSQSDSAGSSFGLTLATHVPFGALELIDYLVAAVERGFRQQCLERHARLCASGFFRTSLRHGAEPVTQVSLEHRHGAARSPSLIGTCGRW